jgi:serine/threonine protein kinase
MSDAPAAVLLREAFRKKGAKFGFWHNCYCTLSVCQLSIFKSSTSREPRRVITIRPNTRIDLLEHPKLPRFVVFAEGEKPICLGHHSIDTVRFWVNVLRDSTFQTPGLSMASFQPLRTIGRGFYGKVLLCKKLDSGEFYAIKTIHKVRLLKANKVHTVFREKEVLMRARHPFIVNLAFSFQSESKVYLGLEYVGGGELFGHLQRRRQFSLPEVRLYVAELALAINYLHHQNVIYRDLKPENVLLDNNGHVKLTDFGLVKRVSADDATTQTFCGNSEYLAPEVVRRQPYNRKIDWWALGILTYELLYGSTPFYRETKTQMFDAICNDGVPYPDAVAPEVRSFFGILLEKDATARGEFDAINRHPFFGDLDFARVLAREYRPAFVPSTDGIAGVSLDSGFGTTAMDSFATPPEHAAGCDDFAGFSYTQAAHVGSSSDETRPPAPSRFSDSDDD